MNTKRNIGDRIVLKFVHDQIGGGMIATDKVNGKVCRTTARLAEVYPDEIWEVVLLGENPKGTINFVDPVRILDSADGIHHLLSRYDLHFYAGLRWTEYRLKRAAQKYGAGSLAYAVKIADIFIGKMAGKGHDLPDDYVRDLLVKALLIKEMHLGEYHADLLPLVDRLGDIELKLGNAAAAKAHYKRVKMIVMAASDVDNTFDEYYQGANLKIARIYYSERVFYRALSHYLNAGPEYKLPFADRKQMAAAYTATGDHARATAVLKRLTSDLMATLTEVQTPTICVIIKD